MPKKVIDYSKIVIYQIVCQDLNIKDCYVGSTTNFTKRKNLHKSACNNFNSKNSNAYVYQFIRNNGNWDNWNMVLVEEYPCENKLQALKRERYWIEKLNATLNQNIPSRTRKEHYQDNKDIIKEKKKVYYDEKKHDILEKRKEYYNIKKDNILQRQKQNYIQNKDVILKKNKDYKDQNIDKINQSRKEYRLINKEKIQSYDRIYYEHNKEKKQQYQKEKIICSCGMKIARSSKSKHLKNIHHD